jgi:Lysophospholipase
MPGSKPNMGKETPFAENDLTPDEKRYMRTLKLVRLKKDIRLWGVTIAFVKAVKERLLLIRKKGWAEDIKIKILFINSLKDRVVSADHILEMSKRLKNSEIINFNNCEHELFMEQDQHRSMLWKRIDKFLTN